LDSAGTTPEALARSAFARLLAGACVAFAGVALVEGLLALDKHPLSPLGWPGLGMLLGAAIFGLPGLAGGATVAAIYYIFNLGQPERFAEFFSSPLFSAVWATVFLLMGVTVVVARPRLLRLAAAEAELSLRRTYEGALRESEQRLRMIADNLPALVAHIDREQRYRFSNRAYETWLGKPAAKMLGRTVAEVWGPERYAQMKPNIERALKGERVFFDYAMTEGGVERHVMAHYVPHLGERGRVDGFLVMANDITELEAARRQLKAAQLRLETALDGSSVALWDTDLRTGRTYLSEAWAGIVGAPPGDTVATVDELMTLLHPDDVDALKRASLEVMKGLRATYALEHRVRARSGEWKWILSRGRVTERDPSTGRAVRMIGTNLDITDRRRIEEAVHSVAHTDPLTGVANRLLLDDRLRLAVARSRRTGAQLALLYVDLDRFKSVNDTLGHAAGDALLKDFAVRLRAGVRASDTVARLGGDEFVVLLEDVKEREHALRVAEKILEDCRKPLAIEGRELVATATLGIAFAEIDLDAAGLLRRADSALYEAKAAGRDCYRVAPR
jgi:diguanylate cyclase (GGDEF)-like protein/PAS domain S-box-containing protein